MATEWHFPILIVVSFIAFIGVLLAAVHRRQRRPATGTLLWVASVVVVGGMAFAKMGHTIGLPVWLYYGAPAVLTWVLPPYVFRMRGHEIAKYLPLAVLVAPTIHVGFSFVLGWKEYMPFIPVPSIWELMG